LILDKKHESKIIDFVLKYRNDWPACARDIFDLRLDPKQDEILDAIQNNPRVSVKSGNARGKDYVGAAAACIFSSLYIPSRTTVTAPTGRQVLSINMSEITKIMRHAKNKHPEIFLGMRMLRNQIFFTESTDWCVEGFKAADKTVEDWSGFHSDNVMVIVTEASGIEDETFTGIEGILTGTVSKLLIIGNPNRNVGEFKRSFKGATYKSFTLNCMDAPNVKARRTVISGQVGYWWVKDKVDRWCYQIDNKDVDESKHDFKFNRKWYRPNDLFLVKVLGQFPTESEFQLIPYYWIELGVQRWIERKGKPDEGIPLRLGVDIAGMGRDSTRLVYRKGSIVTKVRDGINSNKRETVLMENTGLVKEELEINPKSIAFVDTIGVGAGVHSRLVEQELPSVSVQFSEGAKDSAGRKLTDMSGERKFLNMRAYLWWAIRDHLDPSIEGDRLAIPNDVLLIEDLAEPTFERKSSGDIKIEKKDDIKKRQGRSPDSGDALANTYYPEPDINWHESVDIQMRDSAISGLNKRDRSTATEEAEEQDVIFH